MEAQEEVGLGVAHASRAGSSKLGKKMRCVVSMGWHFRRGAERRTDSMLCACQLIVQEDEGCGTHLQACPGGASPA